MQGTRRRSPARFVAYGGWGISVATTLVAVIGWLTALQHGTPLRGADFNMFYTAARLGAEARWEEVYDPELFDVQHAVTWGSVTVESSGASFSYPPLFPQFLTPYTSTPPDTAFVLWSTTALFLSVTSLMLLKPARPWWLLLALASTPMYAMARLGQGTWIALVFLTGAVLMLRSGRPTLAGVALSLLVFKPHLLLGVILWLIVDRRTTRPVLRGLLSGLVSFVGVSALLAPTGWLVWARHLFSTSAGGVVRSSWDYSIAGWLREAGPSPLTIGIAIAAATAVLLAGIHGLRKLRYDHVGSLAWAVALTPLISPRALVYDWLLLAVPLFVLGTRVEGAVTRWTVPAIVAAASTAGYWPLAMPGPAPTATFALTAAVIVASKTLRSEPILTSAVAT